MEDYNEEVYSIANRILIDLNDGKQYFKAPPGRSHLERYAISMLNSNKLIDFHGDARASTAYITPIGRKVALIGVEKYLKSVNNEQEETNILTKEKLRYDVKNAKRIFKTYWITFAIAILGFTISVILAFMKLLEAYPKLFFK